MPQAAAPKRQFALERLAQEAAEIELPPLSTVALEVGRLASNTVAPDSATALSNIVRRDVALAAQIIRVANSALYSPRLPIVSLSQAITRLGMNEIRNICFSFALRTDLFAAGGNNAGGGEAAFASLWRESLATACFAQEIARLKRRDVEGAYLCGLMHRVGLVVMLWRLVRSSGGEQVSAAQLAQFAAAGSEALVGGRLAKSWQLPPGVCATVAHWRTPAAAPANFRLLLMQIVSARALTAQLDADDNLTPALCGLDPQWLEALSLYPDNVQFLLSRRPNIRSVVECYA